MSVAYIGPKSRTDRPMTKIGTEIAHVTRTPLSRSKGQGHQAALLSAALTRGKVLLRCVCSASREVLGRPRRRRGAGHIVSPCAQLNWSLTPGTRYNLVPIGSQARLLQMVQEHRAMLTSHFPSFFAFHSNF